MPEITNKPRITPPSTAAVTPTPQVEVTETVESTPAGLDLATSAGTLPTSSEVGESVAGGISALASRLAGGAALRGDLFELNPGVKNAVPLAAVLKAAGPAAKPLVEKILAEFHAKTGIAIPPALAAAVLANPEHLPNAMQATPKQLSQGIDALNLAHQQGKIADVPPRAHILPETFSYTKIDAQPYTRPANAQKEVAPGLYRGHVPSDLPDANAKMNTITAEVFDRLAANRELDASKRFEVKYGDSTFTRLDTFLDALREDGHEVSVSVRHRVANFTDLSTKLPNGEMADVPVALMVKTGVRDAQGKEAVVPAVHSELVISIKSGPESKHGNIDAEVKWYQGISGTGFFPKGIGKEPQWCGDTATDTFKGDDAQKAIELAGVFSDVVNLVTEGMVADGYGITGVCNDSVSVIQQAMTGSAAAFPLIMRDETVTPHLQGLLNDKSTRGDPLVRDLLRAVEELPSDVTANASSSKRAEASLPYVPGAEAFTSTTHARKVLLGN